MQNTEVADPAAAVDSWVNRLLHRPIPEEDKSKLVNYLAGEMSPSKIATMVALVLASPHFQYR